MASVGSITVWACLPHAPKTDILIAFPWNMLVAGGNAMSGKVVFRREPGASPADTKDPLYGTGRVVAGTGVVVILGIPIAAPFFYIS